MGKDAEIVGIIPSNEWKEDLEKDVEYYYSICEKPKTIYTKRYTPNKYPNNFRDSREELEYQLEEIRRIRQGYDGLCGKGYGFLNYAQIRDPEKGKIRPEFRAKQEEYFKKIEYLQQNPGSGLIGFKRRRWGFTTIGAWDDWHDLATKPYYMIGGISKSESDSRKMFKHFKFIHQNVPDWLRPRSTASDRRDYMEFAWYEKDPSGNRIKKGLESWMSVVAPVPQNIEGEALSKLRIDEAGKINVLLEIWAFGEDCLKINTRRVGIPVCLGTVGSIDSDGKGLMELYMNSKAYDLERFAVYGYHGLIVDKYGNDLLIDAIRWIIYERDRIKNTTRKVREAFIQKYPLCEQDAFYHVSEGGVGNPQLINTQIVKIMSEPPEKRVGFMRRNPDGSSDFVPDNGNGKVIVYSLPDKNRGLGAYVAGADPADHDAVKKTRDSSELALAILSKPYGPEPPRLVLEYCDRPDKLDKFFEQAAMALQWFNHAKVLIEDNRARMINYFKENYIDLLPLVPKAISSARGGHEMKYSAKMTEMTKQQMMGLMEDYIDNYHLYIPSIKLLEQHKVFGDQHSDDDLAIAHGWALMLLQSSRKIETKPVMQPTPTYQSHNGQIKVLNSKGESMNRIILPNSPLFRK